MNTGSLSFRLVTWYAGVLTIVFIFLGVLTLLFLRHYLEANLLDIQARRARQIADTLVVNAGRGDDAVLGKQVEDLYSPEANDRFIRITRVDGAVVYVSGAPKDSRFDPSLVPVLPPTVTTEARKVEFPGGSLLIAAQTVRAQNGSPYRVEVGTSGASSEATLEHVLLLLAIGLPIAVAAAVGGGFVLVRRALRPVDRIAGKAEVITQHNLSERLPVVTSGDEIERLSVSLNRMISRLEEAVNGSKQFVADASHELRTPLTVMRAELESLAQDTQLRSETRESLGSVLEEVERLREIVEGLLALSRLDVGEPPSEWARFDLAELAASTAEQMSLLAEDKELTVVCELSGEVTVEADRARIKQVVVNLLDNAIKYTPRGGRVGLSVARDGDFALLEVTDNGIGIPAEAVARVFNRFYRVDESRSREQGGAGLGLAIVKSICAAHGAQVQVVSTPGKGSRFRIRQRLALNRAAHG
jgi:heavy metal sensor kinase